MDENQPKESDLVAIPRNFIYAKGFPKGADLTNRLAEWHCLDRTVGRKANVQMTLEDLAYRMKCLRGLIQTIGRPRIIQYFCNQFHQYFPDIKWNGVSEIQSIDNFVHFLSNGKWDSKKREMADFALHSLWGTQNTWALELEVQILLDLEMKYGPKLKDRESGKKLATKTKVHPGDFVKDILVAQRSSIFGRVKNRIKAVHKEVLYVRLKSDRALNKDVMWIRTSSKATYGFNGMIGICRGHADEYVDDPALRVWTRPGHQFGVPIGTPSPPPLQGQANLPPTIADSPNAQSMMEFFETMGPLTPEDLVKICHTLNKTPPSHLVTEDGGDDPIIKNDCLMKNQVAGIMNEETLVNDVNDDDDDDDDALLTNVFGESEVRKASEIPLTTWV